jgi:hypothetical protein
MNWGKAVRAALRILAILSSESALAGQSSDKVELPTGDVWVTHAERVFVPEGALAPQRPTQPERRLGDKLLLPKVSPPNSNNSERPEIKLNIVPTIRSPEASTPRTRTAHHSRPTEFSHHQRLSSHHAIRPPYHWAAKERAL